MIEIITAQNLISKSQKHFIKRLREVCTERIFCILGNKGASSEVDAYYSKKYNFWFSSYKNDNRFWNAFGPGKPLEAKNNSITVEINPPLEGINRRIGGAFGMDNNGNIMLMHRGRIGGGGEGIGKRLFYNNIRGDLVKANDKGVENEFCLIGDLSSKLFPKQVANFVHEIRRIKDSVVGHDSNILVPSNFSFNAEHSGIKDIQRSGTTTYNWTHGIVVNALAKLLESKRYDVRNDRNRDLFVVVNGRIKKLFEVKTNTGIQSLCTSIGQLLLYSIPIRNKLDLILVIPAKLETDILKRLQELGINVLIYHWNEDEPVFENLKNFL